LNAKRNELISQLEIKVSKGGFVLNISQAGMMILPSKNGKPMDDDTIAAMPEKKRKKLQKASQELQRRHERNSKKYGETWIENQKSGLRNLTKR